MNNHQRRRDIFTCFVKLLNRVCNRFLDLDGIVIRCILCIDKENRLVYGDLFPMPPYDGLFILYREVG